MLDYLIFCVSNKAMNVVLEDMAENNVAAKPDDRCEIAKKVEVLRYERLLNSLF